MLSKKKKFNLLPKKWPPARRGWSCRSLNFYKRNKVQKKQTPVFQRNNWRSELKKLLVVVDFAERQRQCQVGDAERGRASREDLDRKNSLRFKTGNNRYCQDFPPNKTKLTDTVFISITWARGLTRKPAEGALFFVIWAKCAGPTRKTCGRRFIFDLTIIGNNKFLPFFFIFDNWK